jgi:hypothetical protein
MEKKKAHLLSSHSSAFLYSRGDAISIDGQNGLRFESDFVGFQDVVLLWQIFSIEFICKNKKKDEPCTAWLWQV